jgi:SAM-dependent methyltransferase
MTGHRRDDGRRTEPDGTLVAGRTPSDGDPALADLRRRYAALDTPLAAGSPRWNAGRPPDDLDLASFRADNAYLWQVRDGYAGASPQFTYRRYAHYLRRIDHRRLLDQLGEDGAFGAVTFPHTRPPVLSRDLLDSVNELCFLDRRWHLFDRAELAVLDIGAGYGRLAHRMAEGVTNLRHYLCVDVIPESTYLSTWYLRQRRTEQKTEVIPLDQLTGTLAGRRIDLAINIRSFTEMSAAAITAWLDVLDQVAVPALYLIPNHSTRLHSHEPDGQRQDMRPELHQRGYRLTADEPLILDDTLRATTHWTEHHLLYQRTTINDRSAAPNSGRARRK